MHGLSIIGGHARSTHCFTWDSTNARQIEMLYSSYQLLFPVYLHQFTSNFVCVVLYEYRDVYRGGHPGISPLG